MIDNDLLCKKRKIHFIGIGGISMSSLARYFLSEGYTVSGSDIHASFMTGLLYASGAKIYIGHAADNIGDSEIIVYNSAIPGANPELKKAKAEGRLILPRSALLSYVSSRFKNSVAVCGSHGKTTATALISHVLRNSAYKTCSHIGGEDALLSNFNLDGSDIFITEACEYRKNFLLLKPGIAVLLNIDLDHMECYDGEEDVINTFTAFCNQSGKVIINGDDKHRIALPHATTFGLGKQCFYRAVKLRNKDKKPVFTVLEGKKKLGRFSLNIYGKHNVYNALAAIAAGRHFGMSAAQIQLGLNSFSGIKRRFESLGRTKSGAAVIADYAHHPREIMSVTATAKQLFGKRLVLVFQPHTYSRTKLLLGDFISSLSGAKHVLIYDTYPAREAYDFTGSAKRLSAGIANAIYFPTALPLFEYLELTADKGYTVLVLGAGDIYDIFKDYIDGI